MYTDERYHNTLRLLVTDVGAVKKRETFEDPFFHQSRFYRWLNNLNSGKDNCVGYRTRMMDVGRDNSPSTLIHVRLIQFNMKCVFAKTSSRN